MASTKVVFLASIMVMILGSSLLCEAASRLGCDFEITQIGTRCGSDSHCNVGVMRNDCRIKACISGFCFCKPPHPTSPDDDEIAG